jgi:hypothetical protein
LEKVNNKANTMRENFQKMQEIFIKHVQNSANIPYSHRLGNEFEEKYRVYDENL